MEANWELIGTRGSGKALVPAGQAGPHLQMSESLTLLGQQVGAADEPDALRFDHGGGMRPRIRKVVILLFRIDFTAHPPGADNGTAVNFLVWIFQNRISLNSVKLKSLGSPETATRKSKVSDHLS